MRQQRPGPALAALARSGLMGLTGGADERPSWPPATLSSRLASVAGDIERLTADGDHPVRLSWEAALCGRAALMGLTRQGRTSPNGTCRLLRAWDGWVALNLARPEDVDLIPALVGRSVTHLWTDVGSMAGRAPAAEFVARARMLGLPAAVLPEAGPPVRADPEVVVDRWGRRAGADGDAWRVVDLSSLWAGPLVARILAEAGALVTRIESPARPDGARATPAFHQWLHSDDETTVLIDLGDHTGRKQAESLIDAADVVIEGSRPRALEHLGLGPDDRPGREGRVWLSITGYGRETPGRDWVAFGDDASVAGGLVGRDPAGDPVFCGDAVADPITGVVGARAVLRARHAGGGQLIDLAMSRAASFAAGTVEPPGWEPPVEPDGRGGWTTVVDGVAERVRAGPPTLELFNRGGR